MPAPDGDSSRLHRTLVYQKQIALAAFGEAKLIEHPNLFYAVAIAYFAAAGRHKLVLSPEEEFAVTKGVHGPPEREGYGVTEREEELPPAAPV